MCDKDNQPKPAPDYRQLACDQLRKLNDVKSESGNEQHPIWCALVSEGLAFVGPYGIVLKGTVMHTKCVVQAEKRLAEVKSYNAQRRDKLAAEHAAEETKLAADLERYR